MIEEAAAAAAAAALICPKNQEAGMLLCVKIGEAAA